MKYLLKVEEIKYDSPIYKEVKTLPLVSYVKDVEETANSIKNFDINSFYYKQIKDQLGKIKEVYVDETSWNLLNEIIVLSNLYAECLKEKLNENFVEELHYNKVKNREIVMKIKKLPWYKRLLNNF